jgi:hypothetical protein
MKGIRKEYKESNKKEVWLDGVLSNFIYGMLGAVVITTITLGVDLGVLLAYLVYYFYLGKVVNRPKYVTSLGKFIIFPVPTAIGAFVGYKMGPLLLQILT